MNETLKKIGLELRRRYEAVLRLPLNWRMIDAISHLEEVEESKAKAEGRAPRKLDETHHLEADSDREASSEREPQRTDRVVELPERKRQA